MEKKQLLLSPPKFAKENIPKGLIHLIKFYEQQEKSDPSEGRFKEYVHRIVKAKLRRNPSRVIIDPFDVDALTYLYFKP